MSVIISDDARDEINCVWLVPENPLDTLENKGDDDVVYIKFPKSMIKQMLVTLQRDPYPKDESVSILYSANITLRNGFSF